MSKQDPPVLDFSDSSRIIEPIRELFVLIVTSGLGIIYFVSLYRIYLMYKKILKIEIIALLSCCIEAVLVLIYEFLVPIKNAEFTMFMVQILILTFFFFQLLKTFIETSSRPDRYMQSKYLKLFYGVCAVVILINWLVVIILGLSFSCEDMQYELSWFIMLGFYALICTLNLVFGTFIVKKRFGILRSQFEISQVHVIKSRTQLNTFIRGNFCVSYLLLLWLLISNSIIENTTVACDKNYWRPKDNYSAIFMFIWSVLIMIPTFIFWITFYYFHSEGASYRLLVDQNSSISSVAFLKSIEIDLTATNQGDKS